MRSTYHRGPRWAVGIIVAGAVIWACLRRRPFGVKVEGLSMTPTLLPGDWALAVPVRRVRRGDVVVVVHPDRPGYEMVKRVRGVPGEVVDRTGPDGSRTTQVLPRDQFWVAGDHEPASTDSRDFGPVGIEALKAKVILIYWPAERRRLLGRRAAGG